MNLDLLNDKQKEAVLATEGPVLILAGAGSGKTKTLTYRMAHLIDMGVSPYEILAVTFTNKAANEMRERVEAVVGKISGSWIMTFHSMSLRILRKYPELIGYNKDFTVYDTVDTKALVKSIIKDFSIDSKNYPPQYFLSIISKQKEQDISPDTYDEINGGDFRSKIISKVYREYQIRLKKNNAMDFDDLLLNCLHLLKKNPDVLCYYQNKFKYIMVDEYQDTNSVQYEIVHMLSEGYNNLCVVGDDDQCIYEWRGADITNILNFEKDFKNTKVIKLEQNYRSYQNILSCAYSVIKNNKGRKDKKLWTSKEDGDKVLYRKLQNDKEEAMYIAQEIRLLSHDRAYSDFAILYRTNAQSRLFEDSLRGLGIPYQVLSGFSFYERKETKDMISYLRLVVNPKDDMAFERVINEPKRGVGQATLSKLSALASVNERSLFETISDSEVLLGLSEKVRNELITFRDLIQVCSDEIENLTVSDIYDNLLVKSGYLKSLEDEHTTEADGRIENLLDFKSFIYDYEKKKKDAGEEISLNEFLENVSISSDQDNYDSEAGKVTLMTIHSAKGLEFPIVFVPGMEEGLFPSSRSMDSENGLEEERRLCYVAFTRAMERLILTSAEYRVRYGQGDNTIESTFLKEIDPKLLSEKGDSVFRNTNSRNRIGMDTGSLDGFSKAAFDPLKYMKKEVKENASNKNFSVGDRVTHSKFGFGTVTDIDNGKGIIEVNFEEAGIKRLALAIAPLKKA